MDTLQDTIDQLMEKVGDQNDTIRELEREIAALKNVLGQARTTFDGLAESCADMLRTLA